MTLPELLLVCSCHPQQDPCVEPKGLAQNTLPKRRGRCRLRRTSTTTIAYGRIFVAVSVSVSVNIIVVAVAVIWFLDHFGIHNDDCLLLPCVAISDAVGKLLHD